MNFIKYSRASRVLKNNFLMAILLPKRYDYMLWDGKF